MKANHPTKEHRRKVAKRVHLDRATLKALAAQRGWFQTRGSTPSNQDVIYHGSDDKAQTSI